MTTKKDRTQTDEPKPAEMTKFQTGEPVILNRQSILNAPYNPRTITDYALKELKKNLKRVGLMGGIVVNKRTMHLISGHQRLIALDQIEKSQDYKIRVEMVDVDEKTEMEQNIFMNSTTVQGAFDLTLLKDLIPNIDFELAGLDRYDLNQMGVEMPKEMSVQVEEITADLTELNQTTAGQRAIEAEARKQHVIDTKAEVMKNAADKAGELEAYVVISFDTSDNKAEFMKRFGFDPAEKFIKGEVFGDMIEAVLEE